MGRGRSITDRRSITDSALADDHAERGGVLAPVSGGRWSGGVSGLSESGDNGYKVGIAPHS